jgi:hypothetical protein
MAAAVHFEEAALPAALQRGLAAVRGQVADATVVAVHDNFAAIDIGELSGEDMQLFTQNSAGMFVRVPLTFPNAAPYGVITSAFLTRKDGAVVERQHANAAPVAAYLGRADLGFWSWDWTGMPLRRSEDLAAIVAWATKRIRQG